MATTEECSSPEKFVDSSVVSHLEESNKQPIDPTVRVANSLSDTSKTSTEGIPTSKTE